MAGALRSAADMLENVANYPDALLVTDWLDEAIEHLDSASIEAVIEEVAALTGRGPVNAPTVYVILGEQATGDVSEEEINAAAAKAINACCPPLKPPFNQNSNS